MCMAATKNAAGLIAARFFLGVPESGIGMNVVRAILGAILMIFSAVYCILLLVLVSDTSCSRFQSLQPGTAKYRIAENFQRHLME